MSCEAVKTSVHDLAEKTLLSKAKTWYVGANVEGKPRGLTLYAGGFARYNGLCATVAADEYKTLIFDGETDCRRFTDPVANVPISEAVI